MKLKYLCLSLGLISCLNPLLAEDSAEKAFTRVYEKGEWGRDEKGRGISGSGSTVTNAAFYIVYLQNFLKSNEIRSVVDVGCGDWSLSKNLNWENVSYTGIDVVKDVIERNTAGYSAPNVKFLCGDILTMNLPSADLLICKDVLQHLPNDKVQQFLKQTRNFKHCLITNDVDPNTWTSANPQITIGDWRPIDLTKPPFNVKGTKVYTYRSGYVLKQVLYIKNTDWLETLMSDLTSPY